MQKITLLQVFRKYIAFHENTSLHFEKRKAATINQYLNKYRVFSEFLETTNSIKLIPSKFTPKVAHSYYRWMMEEKKYAQNYAVRCIEICKTVMSWGIEQGVIKSNPAAVYKQRKTLPTPPPYLTPEQIKSIESYTSHNDALQNAADLLVLQLNTGFDYGDFIEIKREHIMNYKGAKYVVKPRHKNGQNQIVPVSVALEKVLEKHNYNLKLMSNPRYNLALKDLSTELKLDIYLTAKEARKLFMMNKLNNEGYSMEAVSRMGGHKTIRTTETYYAQVNISLIHKEFTSKQLM